MNAPNDPAFRISAARLRLMQYKAAGLLAEVGYSLTHTADESIPTLCTDGKKVAYNPAFCASLPDADLETALCHEYGHVALLHPVRCPKHYDRRTANEAMDYAVNQWLADAGRTIPSTWLFDAQYKGMAWELIYTLLMNQKNPPPPPPPPPQEEPDTDDEQNDEEGQKSPQEGQDGNQPGDDTGETDEGQPAPGNSPADAPAEPGDGAADGPGKPGDILGDVMPYPGKDGTPATDAELSEAAAELTDRITRIAEAQAIAGQESDGSRRFLDSLTTPRDPDLYEALAQLLERAANNHTWRRLNRRLSHAGMYPGIDGEECPPLVIAIDTSGSISDQLLAAFNDKVRRAVADFRPRAVTIVYCDSRINGTPETYTPDDLPDLTPHGGGGTDFSPPFAWVAQHMEEAPSALVYLTDLDGPFPDEAPAYPVIWAAIPSRWQRTPPFGQTVPLLL